MDDNVFDTVSFDALYRKSADCIDRALLWKGGGDPFSDDAARETSEKRPTGNVTEYQLWTSVGLELLGKAALAHHHPCLVVDPSSRDSILVAAGVGCKADGRNIDIDKIRTISAQATYKLLGDIIPDYGREAYDFCLRTSRSRNALLHSAVSSFSDMEHNWEEIYWGICQIILVHVGSSLGEWLDRERVTDPARVSVEADGEDKTSETAVAMRIQMAQHEFLRLSDDRRKMIFNKVNKIDLKSALKDFTNDHEIAWNAVCPACDFRAFMAGNQTAESISDFEKYISDPSKPLENFKSTFAPSEFICAACGLRLTNSDEIRSAGLYTTYQK